MRQTLLLPLTRATAVPAAGFGGDKEDRLSTSLPQSTAHLRVSSPAFINGARLHKKYTCDGASEEPVVRACTVPPRTSELGLIVSDPDTAKGTCVHLRRATAAATEAPTPHRARA